MTRMRITLQDYEQSIEQRGAHTMSRLEDIKKTSKDIEKIGIGFQIISGLITGFLIIATILLFIVRDILHLITLDSQIDLDFRNMGFWGSLLADRGRITAAIYVVLLSGIAVSFMITWIMYLIVKIFRRFSAEYSPFLPETVKDLKTVSILAALLILQSSIGLGIIAGFVFWGIVQLYAYGCELQNQVDETL